MDYQKLVDEAFIASENAYAPYSSFKVGASLLLTDGTIIHGTNIENAAYGSTMCAERNAIANMITNGEHQIDKMVAVVEDGSVGAPCGACREYMMQLDKDSGDIEILVDFEKRRIVRLKELIPDWWGKERFLVEE